MKAHYLSLIAAHLLAVGARIAGEFINLNFDNPNFSGVMTDPFLNIQYGPAGNILRGWDILQSGEAVDRVYLYNQGSVPPITLGNRNGGPEFDFDGPFLLSYVGSRTPLPGVEIRVTTTLSQQGTIPSDTIGFEFWWGEVGLIPYSPLQINGTEISIYSDPQTPHNYYGDVSNWAGQEVMLSFEFKAGRSAYLDDLSFVSVPEPSTWALLGVGGLALGIAFRRRRTRCADQLPGNLDSAQ